MVSLLLRVLCAAAFVGVLGISADTECGACRACFASPSEGSCVVTCNTTWPANDQDRGFESCQSFCERVSLMKEIFAILKSNISDLPQSERDGILASLQVNKGDPCISMGYCAIQRPAPPKAPATQTYRPFVAMHGHASNAASMDTINGWVKEDLPGIYIKNVEIGDGKLSAIFMNLNKQVQDFAAQLAADPALQNGFNMLGYSQGALITRAFIERFNHPQPYNWISLAGPNGGQFGLGVIPEWLMTIVSPLIRRLPYCPLVQETFCFAQYWKNPFNFDLYLKKSVFLADINNEKDTKNPQYKENMLKLHNAILLFSDTDNVIRPQISGWFEFFAPGQQKVCTPLDQSAFWKEDFIGLRALNETGQLQLFETDCLHNEHHTEPCKDFFYLHGIPYLNNTF